MNASTFGRFLIVGLFFVLTAAAVIRIRSGTQDPHPKPQVLQ